jgi:hypothetical protein
MGKGGRRAGTTRPHAGRPAQRVGIRRLRHKLTSAVIGHLSINDRPAAFARRRSLATRLTEPIQWLTMRLPDAQATIPHSTSNSPPRAFKWFVVITA